MGKEVSSGERRTVLCVARKETIPAIQAALAAQSADAVICADINELCRNISDRVDAVFVDGSALSESTNRMIAETLDLQPDWSDLPVVIAIPGGQGADIAVTAVRELGNVLVLDHPFSPAALENTLRVAFRSRERQRWIRDLTTECEHTLQTLQNSRNQLEQRVQERTGELAESTHQLRRLTGELILSEQRERRRLAKILHDDLQQLLVSAKYRVASLNRSEDPMVRDAVHEVEDLLGQVIAASRALTSELGPAIPHGSGLRTGMEWLVSFIAAETGLTVELHMDESFDQVDENTKILLIDLLREILLSAAHRDRFEKAEIHVRRAERNTLQVHVPGLGTALESEREGTALFRIRHRLELMGGSMQVQHSQGNGTAFSVSVPLAEPAAVVGTAPETAPPSEAAMLRRDKPVSSMIRLLIVDDHAVMRQGLSTSLRQEPDITIVGEAADGKAALEKARSLHPDVILMDLGMPGMSGIEATRIIHAELPRVRVIGLSMFEEKERANAMFEAGAVAYLTKTCSVDALTSAIRRCIGKPELPAVGRR